MIDIPEQELRARLLRRWEGYGVNEEEIAWNLGDNDLPNGRVVRENSAPAEFMMGR